MTTDPGSLQWELRPSWRGRIYGDGKAGTGRENVINPEAVHLWPPVESKHRD